MEAQFRERRPGCFVRDSVPRDVAVLRHSSQSSSAIGRNPAPDIQGKITSRKQGIGCRRHFGLLPKPTPGHPCA